jgi:hypothetical protein
MAKKQTFGDKVKKSRETDTLVKVIYSQKPDGKEQYSFTEKMVRVPENGDMIKEIDKEF